MQQCMVFLLLASIGSFALSTKIDNDVLPHIIFILADDVGYNDVGWAGDDYKGLTPTLDDLKTNGVELTNFYTQQLCTPARAALMTGRYPFKMGLQDSAITMKSDWGVPRKFNMMPEYLAEVGYESHIVGKWHLGHAYEYYAPHMRGFTSFYGFYDSAIHYRSHRTISKSNYLDFTESWGTGKLEYVDDLGAKAENGWRCVPEKAGEYSTTLFTERAINIANQWSTNGGKEKNVPLFFYMSYQNAHSPTEPDETMDYSKVQSILDKIDDSIRKDNAKLMFNLDYEVKKLLTGLEEAGVLEDNYIIVFASDNGPCYQDGGSQYPLRGSKKHTYEGGAKTRAFIYSPLLPNAKEHTKYDGLFHMTDWLPTFMEAVSPGWSQTDEAKELDGISQWTTLLSGATDNFPRNEIVYNIQKMDDDDSSYYYGAIRVDEWKLVLNEDCMSWHDFGSRYDDEKYFNQCDSDFQCTPDEDPQTFLFNLDSDPIEFYNLKDEQEAHFHRLKNRFKKHAQDLQNPISDRGISSIQEIIAAYEQVGCLHPWLST